MLEPSSKTHPTQTVVTGSERQLMHGILGRKECRIDMCRDSCKYGLNEIVLVHRAFCLQYITMLLCSCVLQLRTVIIRTVTVEKPL